VGMTDFLIMRIIIPARIVICVIVFKNLLTTHFFSIFRYDANDSKFQLLNLDQFGFEITVLLP